MLDAQKDPQQYFNYMIDYMNKSVYEKIIDKFTVKLKKMEKSGKSNTPQYQLHKQVIEELTQKLKELQ